MLKVLKSQAQRIERRVRTWIRGLPGDAWERASYVSQDRPLIIGGCGRSGTTLFSAMIDAHPLYFCGPESRLFPAPSLNPQRLAEQFGLDAVDVRRWVGDSGSKAEFIERFFSAAAELRGKSRWAEKTPGNIKVIDRIFESFPRARFVHVIRDGRDVVCSSRTHPKYRYVRGERVETGIQRPAAECAQRWVSYVRQGRVWRGDPRCTEVRYEDVVMRPEETLRRVFEFLEAPWSPQVLEFHHGRGGAGANGTDRPLHRGSLGRWQRDLVGEDRETVRRIAGDLLVELGYENDTSW